MVLLVSGALWQLQQRSGVMNIAYQRLQQSNARRLPAEGEPGRRSRGPDVSRVNPKPRKEELGNDAELFTANSHYSRTGSVIPSRLLPAQTTRGHREGRGGRRASYTSLEKRWRCWEWRGKKRGKFKSVRGEVMCDR